MKELPVRNNKILDLDLDLSVELDLHYKTPIQQACENRKKEVDFWFLYQIGHKVFCMQL